VNTSQREVPRKYNKIFYEICKYFYELSFHFSLSTLLFPFEIMWNGKLMQLGNFIHVSLARHVSGTYAHHQEHRMWSCSIWFSTPSLWMGGGLESRCVGRVYGADCAMTLARHHPNRTHDPRSGSQDHHQSKNSVQETISYSWWWAYVPETCRAKDTSINYLVASRWHFTLFRDEDARSNNTQIYFPLLEKIQFFLLWLCFII